jgi:hypothetical protein
VVGCLNRFPFPTEIIAALGLVVAILGKTVPLGRALVVVIVRRAEYGWPVITKLCRVSFCACVEHIARETLNKFLALVRISR